MKRLLTYEDLKPDWKDREVNWEWFLHVNETYFKNKLDFWSKQWPV